MNPAIVIPTYWAREASCSHAPGSLDHATDPAAPAPELDACLASLSHVRGLPRVILLVSCPSADLEVALARVRAIAAAYPTMDILIISAREATAISKRVLEIAPVVGEGAVSLKGYGAIRNLGLAVAAVLGHDAVIFLDDDETVLAPDFMQKALYGLGQETRQRLPILVKSGYFYNRKGSPLADTTKKVGITNRWWTKRIEFNRWMSQALKGTRISRSNYLCGGCFVVHARVYKRVAFDPFISRGEDLDYLFNMRLFGLDVWFDNAWVVRHLPPPEEEHAPRFMQNVYRWYYEREKLAYAARQPDLNQVTPAAFMPYPGPWISDELDERVLKTAWARTLFTRERRGYARVLRRGIDEAKAYAHEHRSSYLRFQSFWPTIMNGLWNDARLASFLEDR